MAELLRRLYNTVCSPYSRESKSWHLLAPVGLGDNGRRWQTQTWCQGHPEQDPHGVSLVGDGTANLWLLPTASETERIGDSDLGCPFPLHQSSASILPQRNPFQQLVDTRAWETWPWIPTTPIPHLGRDTEQRRGAGWRVGLEGTLVKCFLHLRHNPRCWCHPLQEFKICLLVSLLKL